MFRSISGVLQVIQKQQDIRLLKPRDLVRVFRGNTFKRRNVAR